MHFLYLILGFVGFLLGVFVATRRSVEPRQRLVAGSVALGALVIVIYAWAGSSYGEARRYATASKRQGYALGFGLGQYLKQGQPGRRVAILRATSISSRDQAAIRGLKDGLEGAVQVVAERDLDVAKAVDFQAAAALCTKDLLSDLKNAGADIVVSFLPLSMRFGPAGEFDLQATRVWWSSSEYSALEWVFPYPPDPSYPWPPGAFRDARVLAMVREKPQNTTGKNFPAYLEIKGKPAELFKAWFELVTTDTDQ